MSDSHFIKDKNFLGDHGDNLISADESPLRLKSQRLTSALYLVTDFLSDSDPLKWRLRELSLDISLKIGDLQSHIKKSDSRLLETINTSSIINQIQKLLSLVDIALLSGFVSQMNFSLLKKEYLNLASSFNSISEESVWENYLLDERPKQIMAKPSLADDNIKNIKSNMSFIKREVRDLHALPTIKKRLLSKDEKQYRKEKIINFLKGKDWVSIKDISLVAADYSLKTIQRELNDLVENNVLKKKGDRRWSRYALI